ncbi:MAG TPA: arginyltransferase, partial [Gammaproteobacteria bacterium]|nr:arginyltransferase [Gammaproteobacteria bacterium]
MSKRELQLFSTPPHPCSYLDDRSATNVFLDPDFRPDPVVYGQLLDQGFRRSGQHIYRPACQSCHECQPARVPSSRFRP